MLEVRRAVLERLQEERTLYDELMARALRLASSTFEDIDPRRSSSSRDVTLARGGRGEDPEVTLEDAAHALRMIEEKTRLVQLLDDYIER